MRRPVSSLIAFVILLFVLFGTAIPSQASPHITNISPTSAPAGGELIIGGDGFGATQGTSSVTINGQPVTLVYNWSAVQLFVQIPLTATTGSVVVKVAGVKSNSITLTIVPAPSMTSVSSSSGPINDTLTITGTNFVDANESFPPSVTFYPTNSYPACGFTASPISSTNTSIQVQVPPGATTGQFAVFTDGVGSNPLPFTVTGALAPVADAGADQVVPLGSTAQLNGTASYDLNGYPLSYQWSLWSAPVGSKAVLQNPTSPFPTFIPDVAGPYSVSVTVSNGTFSSGQASVTVVSPPWVFGDPTVSAGPDQTVNVGATVSLDASGTTDIAGLPITSYHWILWYMANANSQAVFQGTTPFSNPNSLNPTFVASAAGSYFAVLWVQDSYLASLSPYAASSSAIVKITTINSQPVANAGPVQNIQAPQTVQLDGTGSTDVDGNALSYSWAILSKPAGSTATLSNPSYPQPTFYADVVGPYVVQLIVNDGTINSLPTCSTSSASRTSTVTITNAEIIPIADPGPAQTAPIGATVTLSGADSVDFDGHPLSYSWTMLSKPSSSNASLFFPTSANPYFTVDVAGKYAVQLIVNDGVMNSTPQTVLISTDNSRPVADSGPHQTLLVGSTVQLSGAASNDADGNSLTYQWAILYQPSGAHAVLSSSKTVDPTFVASVAGLYVVQLIVNDGQLNSSPVTTWIKAESQNQAPVVSAGPNQTITLPINTVSLNGTATDDGLPNGTLIITWSVVSGPGTVTFFNPNEAVTQATFSAAGTYVLRLTANDTLLSTSATTTVMVNPPLDQPPVVSAGPNQTITLPANIVTLNGSATDGGLPLTTTWSVVSGAGPVLFANGSVPVTTAMFTIAGVYDLRLTASNGQTSASADATITVNPQPNTPPSGTIVLTPASAGPINTGTAQQLQATVTNNLGGAITNTLVTFKVSGPNATTGTATTNSNGVATFSYTGTKAGVDAVVATATVGSLPLTSNSSMISWVLSSPGITGSTVTGQFFVSPHGSGTFDIAKGTTAAFTQTFASINFNPPTGSIPGMPNTIGVATVPFTDVTTDANGNYTGSVIAQGNGLQAGAGTLATFEAVFTGTFTVAAAGEVTFNFLNADGFVFGIGNGAQRVSGTYVDPPTSTAFNGYAVMGSFNTVTAPVANTITVKFPAAGSYPYEVDYADSNQVSLIPPGSTWKYQIANPTLGNITSISRSNGIVTISVNQNLSNFVKGTVVTVSGVTDATDFPNSNQTVTNVNSDGGENTTFTVTWAGSNASSSGGTLNEQLAPAFFLIGFDDSGFSLGQAPFTNVVGGTGTQGCPLIGKTLFPEFGIVDLRKLITLPPGATNVQAQVAIDNDFTLWVNGTQVINQIHENCAFEWNYTVSIPDNLWVSGTNLIAVQARDRGLDTGFEFNLVGPSSLTPAKPQTLLMSTNVNTGQSSVTMAPSANFTQILGQPTTFTALVTSTSGAPAPNIPVTFNVAGANPQQVIITTGSSGTALFSYEGFFVGTDIVEASAQVATTPVVSSQTQVAWTYQTILPQLGTLVLSPSNTQNQTVGGTQTFTVQALDGSGHAAPNVSVTLIVSLDNIQQSTKTTDSSGMATFSYVGGRAGTDTVEADANINGTAAFSNLVTVNWAGQSGGGTTYVFTPQGWIGTPLIGAIVQGQVPIMLASGITLTSGTLQYFPSSNPSNVTVLNANTTGTGPLALGTIDTTLLANGQYTIQLQAIASNGAAQLNETVVSVTGENKPGRETVTVTDLKVPLAGIPINITRTYDSLNRGTVEDFGNGWKLGTTVELSVDLLLNVTFTIDGKRQTFYFTPQSTGSVFFPWLLVPHYTPQPGFHGTLTSNGCGILIYSGGTLVQDSSGVVCFPGGTYLPTVYTYTDAAGRVYTVASSGQLQTIKDLNGNILTFASNGITSSAGGVVVPFVRDSQGRITQITDLNQNNYVYTYDTSCGTGNLCSVTFPGVSNPATYTYYSDTSIDNHLLHTLTDPNGSTWINTYYTADTQTCVGCVGRLQSVQSPSVPGSGGTSAPYITQYSYNATTNATTTTNPDGGIVVQTNNTFGKPLVVTDALNHTTTYAYDANQNLVSQTDPSGNTTIYTYDANGNRTSIKDPAGDVSTKVYNQFSEITSATDAVQPPNTTNFFYDVNFNPNKATDSIGQLYAATYDAQGNAVTRTDANGNTTQLTYDSKGNLVKVVDPLNEVNSFTYDNMDRVLSRTDPRQNQTVYAYDALGNLTDTTDPLGHVVRSTYDLNGNKLTDVDPLGRITSYAYDNLNRLIKVTYPDQSTKQYTYDFRNNKTSEMDQLGRTNLYQYDLAGELQSITYANSTADSGTVKYAYYPNGLKQTLTDEVDNNTTYTYDAASRLTNVKDALGNNTGYGYDADSRRSSMTDANQNTTTYAYDARSRLQTVIYQDTTKDQYTYDGVGNQLTFTDQALNKTTRKYDLVNRLISVTDALTPAGVTQYVYDPAGNLLSTNDANSHITSFQYDSLNHKVLRALPVGMVETFAYDAMGNVSAKTDFNGKTTTYSYDTLNRLLKKTPDPSFSAPSISFTYFPTGTRQTMADASGSTSYTYDNRNRLKTSATPEGTLNYTYDAHSNLLTILSSNTNGASVTYTPDKLNRVGTVTDSRLVAQGVSSATTTYNYFPVGTLQNYTYSTNSVQTAYTYDTLNRLKTIGSSKGSSSLSSFAYTPFPAGNVQTVAELSGRAVNYGYDNDYHLQSETITADPGHNNGAETYTYDPVGNRKTLSSTIPSLPGSNSYSYDANDRLSTDTYDNDGNTISSGGTANTYDFENRMLTHGAVSMVYDGDGNRVSETAAGVTTKYLVDTLNPTGYSQVLDELVSGSVTKTYTYGLQRISENQLSGSTWTPTFYGYDGHGNVRFTTNTAGTVGNTYQFDAFGMPIAATGTITNSYLYSGERFDSNLNLYHLRARYYNVLTGRFETMDSDPGNIVHPKTLHKYVYTGNNPVNAIDPTGKGYLEYLGQILGEDTLALRWSALAVRTELFEACLVGEIIQWREIGLSLPEAIAEATVYCSALYPPIP